METIPLVFMRSFDSFLHLAQKTGSEFKEDINIMSLCLNYDVTGFPSTKAEILIKFTSMIYASDKELKHIFYLTLSVAGRRSFTASCLSCLVGVSLLLSQSQFFQTLHVVAVG